MYVTNSSTCLATGTGSDTVTAVTVTLAGDRDRDARRSRPVIPIKTTPLLLRRPSLSHLILIYITLRRKKMHVSR